MKEETLFSLQYMPVQITFKALKKAMLPGFLGSALRGALGWALQANPDVSNYLYNNRTFSGNKKDILNPYVLVLPEDKKTIYDCGDLLCFQVCFLGEATRHVQSFVQALERQRIFGLGAARYPFIFTKAVHCLDQRVIWQEGMFYSAAVQYAFLPYKVLSEVKQVTITIDSLLRIRRNGKLLEKIDFKTIIRNIIQRIEIITSRYGGSIDMAAAEKILTLSEKVTTIKDGLQIEKLERYSNRQGKKMDFSGLTGSIQFEGALSPFVPWLYVAQVLHIGRNTTFGMGRIQVEFV